VLLLVVAILVSGLIIGTLARLAVPGPDPMAWWQTILLGLAGSFVGGLVAALLGFTDADNTGDAMGGLLTSVVGATVLLVLFRKFVQGRPITGPGRRSS
jgi:uncharacterized membrane protein YeaQ/YmgE (transglycosylase-associated protein family)